ncbi:universal stress protein UspA [Thioalkalivibrio denitrificans]|uniref:Universal stress protein UspA n=1 Tax=Thioalkalivibrio denitrificans TaxID=108003 RepID=A0A1V3NR85_9GAMM|nr:universal stress protein [Thioalkalivibrio denitrificans]OOG27560.1 universal stress protein UspA [Thioalkalivibrio denitrificans]
MSDMPEVLLVPVDGSKNASAAAAYAARMAEKLGVPVQLLFAFPETPMDMFGWPKETDRAEKLQYYSPGGFEKLRDETAGAAFESAREAMGDSSVSVEEKIITGEAAAAILDHSGSVKGGMIVMGRRGLSRVEEILMGSTTQRVLHHAKCPVLVVH